MSTPTLKSLDLGPAEARPAFRNFSVTQLRDGTYAVTVTYVLQTVVNGEVVAEHEVVNRNLSDAEIRAHPQFAALYPGHPVVHPGGSRRGPPRPRRAARLTIYRCADRR